MNKSIGYISNSGMGGFLNPPTHPEHTHSVSGRNFAMSLSSAVKDEWLDTTTRKAAKKLLDNWQAPAIESAEIQEWILQVLGYFRGCYKVAGYNAPDCWNADKLKISNRNPMLNIRLHAGVHLIRKYYPKFKPTSEHFQNAYWGKKPLDKSK